jgi:hypothetical protein
VLIRRRFEREGGPSTGLSERATSAYDLCWRLILVSCQSRAMLKLTFQLRKPTLRLDGPAITLVKQSVSGMEEARNLDGLNMSYRESRHQAAVVCQCLGSRWRRW